MFKFLTHEISSFKISLQNFKPLRFAAARAAAKPELNFEGIF